MLSGWRQVPRCCDILGYIIIEFIQVYTKARYTMIIDHIGLVVRKIEQGIDHWRNIFGYSQATEIVVNTRQKVRVVFLEKDDSMMIKLTEPTDETSPIYQFAKKGGGLHHICFRSTDMTREIDRLTGQGLRLLAGPEPGEAFENEAIAFLFAKHGLNIELIETHKKANRLSKS